MTSFNGRVLSEKSRTAATAITIHAILTPSRMFLTSCLEAPALLAMAVSPRRNSSPTIAQRTVTLTICTNSVKRSDSSHSFRHSRFSTVRKLCPLGFLRRFQLVEDLVEGQVVADL